MQQLLGAEASLSLRSDLLFLPMATSFAEKASAAFGLGQPEALALTLATEEIFAYLARVAAPGTDLLIVCRGRGYFVEEEFLFNAQNFNMRAFNITFSSALDQDADLEETGLLIASRMVDRFQFQKTDTGLRLILRKDKSYPSAAEIDLPEVKPADEFSIRKPDPDELKIFVRMVNSRYSPLLTPHSFAFPGKVADMAAAGDYSLAVAFDKAGRAGGGILWRWEGQRLVEFFGPYIFNQRPESNMAHALVDSCLTGIARTRAIGMINRYPTPELPVHYFEPLGSLTLRTKAGKAVEMTAHYKFLEEDAGLSIWSHPLLVEFLDREYGRLVFAREIKIVSQEGEWSSPHSVISTEINRGSARATLHPVWIGVDAEETVPAHVQVLLKEGIPNVFFQMDLGKSWQSHFTPALINSGFLPRLVLPNAGSGDLVIFQYEAGEASL